MRQPPGAHCKEERTKAGAVRVNGAQRSKGVNNAVMGIRMSLGWGSTYKAVARHETPGAVLASSMR
jgi:hypothetical protein